MRLNNEKVPKPLWKLFVFWWVVWVWVFLLVSPYVGPWLVGFGWLVGYVVGCGGGGWLGVTVKNEKVPNPL